MTRQCRVEYEGALYHVLSRGNERKISSGKIEEDLSPKEIQNNKITIKGDHICSYGAANPVVSILKTQ